jgi:phosphoribosylaminoimidazole (AIR) synthetase
MFGEKIMVISPLLHLHFEGLGTQLVTFTEGRVDEIAADVMLLTVNDVCVSLFVGDCFPVAGISI